MPPPRHQQVPNALFCVALLTVCACQAGDETPSNIITTSIELYGGDLFKESQIRFDFRGAPFEVTQGGGRYRYQRVLTDSVGATVTEVMENEGSWTEIRGTRVELSPDQVYELETAVNSVVYFGFLPFRLDDSAVILSDLGDTVVSGEPYHKIEATFEREGGGVDWDTRFVFWIHGETATLDYFAYRYSRDGGGARFRRAVNRREVGGLLVQDYENYAGTPEPDDISEFDRALEQDAVELLSMVELEDVEVVPVVDLTGSGG